MIKLVIVLVLVKIASLPREEQTVSSKFSALKIDMIVSFYYTKFVKYIEGKRVFNSYLRINKQINEGFFF